MTQQSGDLSAFIAGDEQLPKGGPAQGAREYILGDEGGSRLQAVGAAAPVETPERAARIVKLQASTGLPEQAIRDNLEEVERVASSGDLDLESLRRRSPALGRWLQENPSYMAASKDDLDTLSNMEALTRAVSMGFGTGQRQTHLGRLSFRQIYGGGDTPDERLARSQLEKELERQPRGEGFMARFVNPAAKFFGQMFESGQEALKAAMVTSAGATIGTAVVAGPAAPVAVPAAAGIGFAAGGIAGYLSETFRVEAGMAYHEMGQIKGSGGEKIGEGARRGAALFVGVVNAALETAGAAAIIYPYKAAVRQWLSGTAKNVLARPTVAKAAARFGEAYAIAILSETATETVQEAVNVVAEEVAKAASDGSFRTLANDPQYRAAALERVMDAGSETLRGMLIVGLPGGAFAAGRTMMDARAASARADIYTAMGGTMESSKAFERLPEQTRDLVRTMVADGPVSDLYVDLEPFVQYWQSKNVDPREAARQVFGSTEEFDAAIDTGAPMRLPTHDYATRVAPTEHNAFFSQEVRRSPTEMNAREAKDLASNAERAVEQEETQVREEEERRAKVEKAVSSQLEQVGYERSTAETMARQMGAFFSTLGKRLGGVNPLRLFGRYGLQVSREGEAPAGSMQQDMKRAQVESPQFKTWFEGSKVVDETGAPLSAWKSMRGDVPHMNRAIGGLTHATLDRDTALVFAEGRPLREVYVSAKNPFDFRDSAHVNRLYNELIKPENMAIINKQAAALEAGYNPYNKLTLDTALRDGDYRAYEVPHVNKIIRQMGYDAIYMVEDFQTNQRPNIAVFSPSQLKSVYNHGGFDVNDPDIMFQSTMPVWYSELARRVETLRQARATPEQWEGTLKNLTGVKKDELEWSGVLDWLRFQKELRARPGSVLPQAVTREEVLQYLLANGVQVQVKERLLGQRMPSSKLPTDEAIRESVEYLNDLGFTVDRNPMDPSIWGIVDPGAGEIMTDSDDVAQLWASLSDAEKRTKMYRKLARESAIEVLNYLAPLEADPTKFSSYQEPGGVNYREMLLTFPGADIHETHYNAKGVLAHVRFNTRTDETGRVGLFLEEIQSQWAQRGRKEGFRQRVPEIRQALAIMGRMQAAAPAQLPPLGALNQVQEQQIAGIVAELPAPTASQLEQGYRQEMTGDTQVVFNIVNAIRGETELPGTNLDQPAFAIEHLLVINHNWLPARARMLQVKLAQEGFIPYAVGRPMTPESQQLFQELIDKFESLEFDSDAAESMAVILYENRSELDTVKEHLTTDLGLSDEVADEFVDIIGEAVPKYRLQHNADSGMWEASYQGDVIMQDPEYDVAEDNALEFLGYPDLAQQGDDTWIATPVPGFAAQAAALQDMAAQPPALAGRGIPAGPFVQSTDAWVALVLKRMVRYAVDNGLQWVAWTTGAQQVARYEGALRKAVDRIEWTKEKGGVRLVGYKGEKPRGNLGRRAQIVEAEMADYQGRINVVTETMDREGDAAAAAAGGYEALLGGEPEVLTTEQQMGEAGYYRDDDPTLVRVLSYPGGSIAQHQDGGYSVIAERDSDFGTLQEMQRWLWQHWTRWEVTTEELRGLPAAAVPHLEEVDRLIERRSQLIDSLMSRRRELDDLGGARKVVDTRYREDELSDSIGKTMADRIRDDSAQSGVIEHSGMKIDDPGMGQFYGGIVPKVAKEVLRKLGGGQVGEVTVSLGRIGSAGDFDVADSLAKAITRGAMDIEDVNRIHGLRLTSQDFEMSQRVNGTAMLRTKIMEQSQEGGGALQKQPGFNIGDAVRESAAAGMPVMQAERGFFRTSKGRKVSIGLLERADLSTFLHESGHFYLEVLRDVTSRASVDEVRRFFNAGPELTQEHVDALRRDVAEIHSWLGVDGWSSLTREHHEKFARGIEAYLMEGRAPSQALRAAFSRFAAWLSALYGTLRNLGVQLNDDVRSVMDRMFATEEEIAAARQEADLDALFLTAAEAGVSEEEFEAYRGKVDRASRDAREELRNRLMRQALRERTALYKEQRAAVQAEVEAEVDARQEYAATAALKEDRLDRAALERMYPAPMGDNPTMQRLRELRLYRAKGGADPSAAASALGYGSANAMVSAVVTAQDRDSLVRELTDQRVRQQFADPMADGARLADEAMAAVHAEGRSQVLEAELNMLRARVRAAAPGVAVERSRQRRERTAGAASIRQAGPDLATLRRVVRGRVEQMRVGDVRPQAYLVASRRASALAKDAAAKNDWQTAAAQKQRELLSVEMYREARRVVDGTEEVVTYARRFGTARVRARLGKAGGGFLEQVDGILERFDFGRASAAESQRRENIRRWVDGLREQGLPVNLPEDVLDEAYSRPYRELTFRELEGVRDSLRHLDHLSRLKNRLLTSASRRELEAAAAEVAQQVASTARRRGEPEVETRLPQHDAARTVDGFLAAHRKMSSLAREMDGGRDYGPVWEYLVRPLNRASDAETTMHAEANARLGALFAPYVTLQEQAKNALTSVSQGLLEYGLYAQEDVPALGRSLSKASRLAVALNWGNDVNRQRLMDGHGWSEAQVEAVLSGLTRDDWQFVQGVWDLVDSYWPQVSELSRRVDGVAPEKVEAVQVQTQFGVFNGGYYPIAYDDRLSPRAYADAARRQAERAMRGASVRSTTEHGFREERSRGAVKRPVRLDLNVVFEHVNEVIHDVTHFEALVDVSRVLGHSAVQAAVMRGYGPEVYAQFRNGVTDVAAGSVPAEGTVDRCLQWARQGASIAAMAWNVTTGLMQPLGLSQSFVRVGPTWVARGLYRWIRDAASMESTATWVQDRSQFMKNRPLTISREVNEIRDKLSAGGAVTPLTDTYFWLITRLQMVADVPTWLGAYERAMEESGLAEDKAVEVADQAVRDAQGSGHVVDLAAVLRGGPLLRLWTNFMSFFITTFNQSAERFRLTQFSDPVQFGRWAVDMLMLYTVPAVLGVAVKEALRGDSGGDWDKILKRLAGEQASYILGTVLLARELGAVFQGYAGWDGPAGARLFSKAAELGRQAMQGEADRAAFKALNETAGILFHYPAGQVQRTADGIAALMQGRTNNPLAVIVGPAPQDLPR